MDRSLQIFLLVLEQGIVILKVTNLQQAKTKIGSIYYDLSQAFRQTR